MTGLRRSWEAPINDAKVEAQGVPQLKISNIVRTSITVLATISSLGRSSTPQTTCLIRSRAFLDRIAIISLRSTRANLHTVKITSTVTLQWAACWSPSWVRAATFTTTMATVSSTTWFSQKAFYKRTVSAQSQVGAKTNQILSASTAGGEKVTRKSTERVARSRQLSDRSQKGPSGATLVIALIAMPLITKPA